MIKRLRPTWSKKDLEKIYAKPHDHVIYGRGHDLRVKMTIEIAKDMVREVTANSGGDLSCGNGAILKSLNLKTSHFGDFASSYEYTGLLEESILKMPNVDLYICSETLEHLDNPQHALELIRNKTKSLILSTPIECWDDINEEHYWAYDREGVEEMMLNAGFTPNIFLLLDTQVFGEPYRYGIWGCK